MKITFVVGARPNFMKMAPIVNEINKQGLKKILKFEIVHTGQHYDQIMSGEFFKELNIPNPNINLECGSGTQSEQTSKIMVKFEKYISKNKSDLVVLFGDVNSTLACAIVARKLNIKVAHIEAGIRSFDWKMPEEINRIVTDSISNYFFTTSKFANENLLKSGISSKNIFFVGNTMIDTLLNNLNNLKKPKFWNKFSLKKNNYLVLTIHRPSNVDNAINLKSLLSNISIYSNNLKVIFPMHPRTKKLYEAINLKLENLIVVDPLSYLEFIFLVSKSLGVITDSGGITEETTVLNIPCITLRNNTERPETVSLGTNVLIGTEKKKIKLALEKLLSGNWKKGKIPQFWDGKTSKRIVKQFEIISKNERS